MGPTCPKTYFRSSREGEKWEGSSSTPARTQAPAGCKNIKILPHIPYIQDDPFTEKDYSEFREKVLDKLERMGIEGLRNHIVTEIEWTP